MKCKLPKNYMKGGKVRGPGTSTSDSILARISNGEYVLPKPAVDMVGLSNLDAIRRAALARNPDYAPGFKYGGLVSQDQWEQLPRFAGGGIAWTPSQLLRLYGQNPPVSAPPGVDLARVAAQRAADAARATAAMSGPASSAPLVPGGYSAPGIGARVVSGLGSLGARAAGGVGMMLYPSELGDGALDSPEAQRAMNANKSANKMAWRGDVPETTNMKSSTPIPTTPTIHKETSNYTVPPPDNGHQVSGAMEFMRGLGKDAREGYTNYTNQLKADLQQQGFSSLNDMPGGRQARTNRAWLGPNDIQVKESVGTPEQYTTAAQNNHFASLEGRRVGLPQGGAVYQPNASTLAGQERGGPVTEYAIPGKGTATFLGERRGGGTLSVVSGRTPEEQAAIDQRVASINSQTAAMRSLRNAQRAEQGLPSVEQEQSMNAMRSAMPRLNTSGLDQQEASLRQQLQSAATGRGNSKERASAIQAAQMGLDSVAAQRKALMGAYNTQSQQALGMLGLYSNENQRAAAERAAAAKAAMEASQFNATYNQTDRNAEREALAKVFSAKISAGARGGNKGITAKDSLAFLKQYTTPPTIPGQNPTFDYEGFNSQFGAAPLPSDPSKLKVGQAYYDPTDPANPYKLGTQDGFQSIGSPADFLGWKFKMNPVSQGALPADSGQ